jgi:hypothetical protein
VEKAPTQSTDDDKEVKRKKKKKSSDATEKWLDNNLKSVQPLGTDGTVTV